MPSAKRIHLTPTQQDTLKALWVEWFQKGYKAIDTSLPMSYSEGAANALWNAYTGSAKPTQTLLLGVAQAAFVAGAQMPILDKPAYTTNEAASLFSMWPIALRKARKEYGLELEKQRGTSQRGQPELIWTPDVLVLYKALSTYGSKYAVKTYPPAQVAELGI